MVLVVAHRGASAHAPENTLTAIRLAVAQGAHGVEIDVRRSRDGEFVVIHDPILGRTADVATYGLGRRRLHVAELTAAQLRRIDVGAWKGSSFVGERIPTLDEVLALVRAARVHLHVEVKSPVGRDRRDVPDLAAVVRAADVPPEQLTIQSFDWNVVRAARSLLPGVSMAVLSRTVPRDLAALSGWVDQVSLHHLRVDRRAISAIKSRGLRCVTWTVNRRATMQAVIDLGVDGVITDHPAALLETLETLTRTPSQRGQRAAPSPAPLSVPERFSAPVSR